MRAIDDTEKLLSLLREKVSPVTRPSVPAAQACGVNAKTPADLCSPMVEGISLRASQIERTNEELRDLISRIEL